MKFIIAVAIFALAFFSILGIQTLSLPKMVGSALAALAMLVVSILMALTIEGRAAFTEHGDGISTATNRDEHITDAR